jgi:serine/threonine protein kinase
MVRQLETERDKRIARLKDEMDKQIKDGYGPVNHTGKFVLRNQLKRLIDKVHKEYEPRLKQLEDADRMQAELRARGRARDVQPEPMISMTPIPTAVEVRRHVPAEPQNITPPPPPYNVINRPAPPPPPPQPQPQPPPSRSSFHYVQSDEQFVTLMKKMHRTDSYFLLLFHNYPETNDVNGITRWNTLFSLSKAVNDAVTSKKNASMLCFEISQKACRSTIDEERIPVLPAIYILHRGKLLKRILGLETEGRFEDDLVRVVNNMSAVVGDTATKKGVSFKTKHHELINSMLDPSMLKIGTQLGSGAYGTVYSGSYGLSRCAVKFCGHMNTRLSSSENEDDLDDFLDEIDVTASLQHEHIVRVMGLCRKGNQWVCVMTQYKQSLRAYLRNGLDLSTKIGLCKQIVEGISFANSRGVIHGDLKTDNVLIDSSGKAVVSDFGVFTKVMSKDALYTTSGLNDAYLPRYPPEILRKQNDSAAFFRTVSSDVYCFAYLLLTIFFGESYPETGQFQQLPTSNGSRVPTFKNRRRLIQSVTKGGHRRFVPVYEAIVTLGLRCYTWNPHSRPSWKQVMDMLDESMKLVTTNPHKTKKKMARGASGLLVRGRGGVKGVANVADGDEDPEGSGEGSEEDSDYDDEEDTDVIDGGGDENRYDDNVADAGSNESGKQEDDDDDGEYYEGSASSVRMQRRTAE